MQEHLSETPSLLSLFCSALSLQDGVVAWHSGGLLSAGQPLALQPSGRHPENFGQRLRLGRGEKLRVCGNDRLRLVHSRACDPRVAVIFRVQDVEDCLCGLLLCVPGDCPFDASGLPAFFCQRLFLRLLFAADGLKELLRFAGRERCRSVRGDPEPLSRGIESS
jgi:hypothetical protein